jgi:polygalacturonase
VARLPVVGEDGDAWGTVLNEYLAVGHNADGTVDNMFVDARDYGVVFDNTTDDTAALQAAIDACVLEDYLGSAVTNDWPAKTLVLPAGRAKITGPLLLPANITIRGHGPSSTYIAQYAAENAFELATGGEVQTQIRDLGIIGQHASATGITLTQSGAPSILGDAAHQIDNVMMVGGKRALKVEGSTEGRFSNILAYRQTPLNGDAAIYILGTDHMVERVTVAQPQYSGGGGGGFGGAALRANTSNTRFVNIKVFGGNASGASEPMQGAFMLIGQRNTITGLEVQDYAGGSGIEDHQGLSNYTNVVLDSCYGFGVDCSGEIMITNLLIVNRAGGAFTMPTALDIANGSGAIVDARVEGVASNFAGGQDGTGNFITINGTPVP